MQHYHNKVIGIQFNNAVNFEFVKRVLDKDRNSDKKYMEFEKNVLYIDEEQKKIIDLLGIPYSDHQPN